MKMHSVLRAASQPPRALVMKAVQIAVFIGASSLLAQGRAPALGSPHAVGLQGGAFRVIVLPLVNNIVDQNYASLVKIPKLEAGSRRPLTDLAFLTLLKGWESAPGGETCLVLCYTGFRVTEFCQLTGGIKTEAGKDRVVPIHPKILPIIERWYAASKGILYTRPDGRAYTKDSFNNGVWKPCMRSLGLPDDLTPHSARHTIGTRMAAAGARPEDNQKILGHSDYSMTANTYIDQDVSVLQNALLLLA